MDNIQKYLNPFESVKGQINNLITCMETIKNIQQVQSESNLLIICGSIKYAFS